MALSSGSRIGPYDILAPLGAGGFGEVYKARDTRLDRTVAIKILPSADPELKARFEREAKAIAALTHSHICALYDVGHQDGTDYLVLEYLEGETLADRLQKGALPLDQALKYAIEIADALDKAHCAGIVHRDLKPANIMLTKSGVKLLDFGLAKLRSQAVAGGGLSMTAAVTTPPITGQGTILGTLQYMAPEQLEGHEADARADVFAFGAVVYEMLTRKKAFEGESHASLISSILKDEPRPIVEQQPLTPRLLDHLVRRCLEKNREARWQSAHDLHDELTWIADDAGRTTPAAATPRARWRERAAWGIAAAAVLVAAAAIAVVFVGRAAPDAPVMRFDVSTPPTADLLSFALSPDGRQLVFVASADNVSKLWLRSLDQTTAQPLAGTEGASYPFWSPDNRAIGFFAAGKLKRLNLAGGLPQVLADAPSARGGTWSPDGVIVFAPVASSPLFRVAASGGEVTAITKPDPTASSHRFPHFLPDGHRFLFFAAQGPPEKQGVYLGSLDGTAPTRLVAADTAAAYAPPGYLLVVQQGVLVARHFDLTRGEVGEFILIAQPVGSDSALRRGAFSVSTTGVLAHRASAAGRRQLVWLDRTGTQVGTLGEPDDSALLDPALASDGRRVAVDRTVRGNQDVWLLETGRGVATRFTFDPALDNSPIWSPDGGRLVFRSGRSGPGNLYAKSASGAGAEQVLLASGQLKQPLDWSPDGRVVLYATLDPKTGWDLWALPLTGDRTPFPVVQTPFTERNGQFSPDGRWVAYDSNESGRFEVSVQPFPGPGGKWQVSSGGGVAPRWRHDGRELFYVAPDGALMAAPVGASADGQALEPGVPARLFRVPIVFGGSLPDNTKQQYDVAPDGQRFLVNVTSAEASASPITVVLNWQAALAAREKR